MRFELYQKTGEGWRWRLIDDSNCVIAVSAHGFENKKHTFATIDTILKMDSADIVDVRV